MQGFCAEAVFLSQCLMQIGIGVSITPPKRIGWAANSGTEWWNRSNNFGGIVGIARASVCEATACVASVLLESHVLSTPDIRASLVYEDDHNTARRKSNRGAARKPLSPPFLPHMKPQRHEAILGNGCLYFRWTQRFPGFSLDAEARHEYDCHATNKLKSEVESRQYEWSVIDSQFGGFFNRQRSANPCQPAECGESTTETRRPRRPRRRSRLCKTKPIPSEPNQRQVLFGKMVMGKNADHASAKTKPISPGRDYLSRLGEVGSPR